MLASLVMSDGIIQFLSLILCANAISAAEFKMHLPVVPGKQQNFCLMCELRRHIRTAFHNCGTAFKPHSIIHKLKCKYLAIRHIF